MEHDLILMTEAIAGILRNNAPSVYLYGSAAVSDFCPGWSDIDLLVLTRTPITTQQAEALLMLRQELPKQHPEMRYARAFEGGMLALEAFIEHTTTTVVYWGTSGQRITDKHRFDSFCLWELHHAGRLLHGTDIRHLLPLPTADMLHADVVRHLRTILEHGHGAPHLYAFGWLLDIARGLYTLRHDTVIAKTAAGEWALTQGLCPDEEALRLALALRYNPTLIQHPDMLAQAQQLSPVIQRFASVLLQELNRRGIPVSA